MSKKDTQLRIRQAVAKARGVQLDPAEAAMVLDGLTTMGSILATLNANAFALTLDAKQVTDAILATLCWDESVPELFVRHDPEGWFIARNPDDFQGPYETFEALVDCWRNLNGKTHADGIQILIPGDQIIEQVSASLQQ